MNDHDRQLRITEIFLSLQGESRTIGLPTVFVRLTGCPLRCGYCDTEYAFSGGEWLDLDDVLETVASHSSRYVTVTGGEPLAQKACIALLQTLCEAGYEVSLETSGALPIDDVDPRVSIVMDIKTPGSGEHERNLGTNIPLLRGKDQIKFVICDRKDYEWSLEWLRGHELPAGIEILFSPAWGEMEPAELAQWLLNDHVQARFQIQLHKFLWGDARGR